MGWQVTIRYNFEARQSIKFVVYDVDSGGSSNSEEIKLESQDLLGKFETSVASVVTAHCKQFTAVLRECPASTSGKKPKIHVYVQEADKNRNDTVQLQLCAQNLDNKVTTLFVVLFLLGFFYGQFPAIFTNSELADSRVLGEIP